MKYLCMIILFFCISCSPHKNVINMMYKIREDCLTEKDALIVSNAYLRNVKGLNISKLKVTDLMDNDSVYYLRYIFDLPDVGDGYSYRCPGWASYIVIIRKTDCEVLEFKRE